MVDGQPAVVERGDVAVYAVAQLIRAATHLGVEALGLLEVLGAALMWQLRWGGFHCYALARLLLLLLPLLFLGRGFVGIGNIMMALLFIVVYFLLMRQLTANEPPQQPNLPEPPTEEDQGE